MDGHRTLCGFGTVQCALKNIIIMMPYSLHTEKQLLNIPRRLMLELPELFSGGFCISTMRSICCTKLLSIMAGRAAVISYKLNGGKRK